MLNAPYATNSNFEPLSQAEHVTDQTKAMRDESTTSSSRDLLLYLHCPMTA